MKCGILPHGFLRLRCGEDMGQTYLAEPDTDGEEARMLRPLQAACRGSVLDVA